MQVVNYSTEEHSNTLISRILHIFSHFGHLYVLSQSKGLANRVKFSIN